MENQFSRTEMLIGKCALEKLFKSHIAVFGLGGVGSYCTEALIRCGIGKIDLIDNDKINETNLNRQLFALHSTIGEFKVDAAKKRLFDINPDIQINAINKFFSKENSSEFDFKKYDYIIDAIDTVSSKIELIVKAKENNVKIISSMGTGNKLNPEMFEINDINKTSYCPLARVIRYELKKRNIKDLKVVYSKEIPKKSNLKEGGKQIPASISFTPPSAGLLIASYVIKDLIQII